LLDHDHERQIGQNNEPSIIEKIRKAPIRTLSIIADPKKIIKDQDNKINFIRDIGDCLYSLMKVGSLSKFDPINSLQGNANENSLNPPLTIGPEEKAKEIAQPKRYVDKTIKGKEKIRIFMLVKANLSLLIP
jgi:hypothetical protein